ncbi:MFS family permease [Lactobacillus colini]|uniref:MFS family permease n=1 Tax=Lactobacillus colini TaxID=1819254 RepID=A0ABS4MBT8_9LACO|nr:MFS transporter [Lactobacillus colini]MBP2057150.1 MFS family permease [Lactobacillus colini]
MSSNKKLSTWKKVLLIIALMALNIVEQAASAISATIPAMAKTFTGVSMTNVEMITTAVNITVTIFVLTSGFISNKIGQKQTAVLGLAIAAITSIIPAFTNSFVVVLMSRIILGIGIGLANPLAISLIGEFFTGDILASLMGWRSAIAGIGVSIMTFFAGQLLNISWHAAYYVYLLFIPVLILFTFFVPQPEKEGLQAQKSQNNDKNKEKSEIIPHARIKVAGLALVLLAYFSLVMITMIKMALLYIEQGIGSATAASNVLSLVGFAQLLGGALFGLAYRYLKSAILPIAVIVGGITMIGIAYTNNANIVMLLSLVSGFIGGMGIPYIFTRVSAYSTTSTAPLNNGIVLVGSNLGSFIAPYVAAIFGKTAQAAFLGGGIAMTGLGIVIIMAFVILNKSKY